MQAAQRFQRDQHTLDSLEGWAHSDTHTAQLAFNSLQLISGCKSNGGDGNVGRQNVEDRDEEEDNEEEIGMDGSDRAQQHQIHTSKERESQQAQQLLEDNDGRELSTSIGVVNNSPVSAAAAVTQMDFSPAPIGLCVIWCGKSGSSNNNYWNFIHLLKVLMALKCRLLNNNNIHPSIANK